MGCYKTTCGHCGKEAILTFGFMANAPNKPNQNGKEQLHAAGMARCPLCEQWSTFEFNSYIHPEIVKNQYRIDQNLDWQEIIRFPALALEIHESWPKNILPMLRDVERHLRDGTSPSTVIGECRAILEAITNKLGAQGKTLQTKIDDLKSKGIIVGVLAEWAHELRMNGNEALHDLQGTDDEAEDLYRFILMLLDVCFTLRFKIDKRRVVQQS